MKLCKMKNDASTIRVLVSDDRQTRYGLIGTVADFLDKGILDYCDAQPDMWVFSDMSGKCAFFDARDNAVRYGRSHSKLVTSSPS